MCGIAGIIYLKDQIVTKESLVRMTNFLGERGPDHKGFYINKNVGLAHSRLSIIDLSDSANQPMESNRAVICFNGEIYNFKDLKKELLQDEFKFKTHSDTEVLLYGYEKWGIKKLLQKAEGMIAMAIYDKLENKLILARDIFGKKPLYYYKDKSHIVFSSDIRAVQSISKTTEIDYESLDYYLTELTSPQPKTIWEKINQVEGSSFIEFDISTGNFSSGKYWNIPKGKTNKINEEEALSNIEDLLKQAINKRQVGDVPIGYFLSSGADSGLIAALASTSTTSPITTYTVGFGDDTDETKLATDLAAKYNTNHKNIQIKPDIVKTLPELINYLGEPFADSSLIPSYYITKQMSNEFKVALSGDGGDEVFGGYYEYGWTYELDQFTNDYPSKSSRELVNLASKLGIKSRKYSHLFSYLQWSGAKKLYRQMGFSEDHKNKLYSKAFEQRVPHFAFEHLQKIWDTEWSDNYSDTLFRSSFQTRLLNDYLVKVDRSSMINSLEVRSPFLDKSLVEYVSQLDNSLINKNGTPKYLLKNLGNKYISSDFSKRKKQGFGIPITHWLRSELKDWAKEIILSGSLSNSGVFNRKYIDQLFDDHINERADHTNRIWTLICLEIWLDKVNIRL